MYAKLFSRIAQSSLMEEPIETRYTFMMLLAIADQSGDVIGTDVALARTINLPLATFTKAVKALMEPDPHSNSQDQEGRRLVPSDNGRGYRIVNYTAYRAIKTAEEKKTYMREYMRARREALKAKDVTPVNICKPALSDVTHAEAEAEAEADTKQEASQPLKRQRAGELLPMDALKTKINSLRPEWKKMPHLSAMEMHTLQGCAHSLECLAESDWRLIQDFLAYTPRGTEKLYQVRSREKFLQTPVDTLTAATEWQKSQGNSPAKSNGGKW
jgi:hypothetical protein